ncbi:MAG: DUF2339 domain-containing protein [Phycisphaeraceae bacterium]
MEVVLVLLAVVLLVSPLIVIVLLVATMQRMTRAEARVQQLEHEMQAMEARHPAGASTKPKSEQTTQPTKPTAPPPPPQPPAPPQRAMQPTPAMPIAHQPTREPESAEPAEVMSASTTPRQASPAEAMPWQKMMAKLERATSRTDESTENDAEENQTLEQRLATQVMLWLGAAALALAGIFMVRYFAEHALMTPAVRLMLAGLFGVGLLVGGQFLSAAQAKVAAATTAAGVAICYATVWAATNLYDLLNPAIGAGGLIIVTAVAVVMSLRHGMIVALLGLLGGFLMPALTGMTDQSALQFFGYLMLLQTALVLLGRYRGWWVLMVLTLVGSLGWTAIWLGFYVQPGDWAVGGIGLFVLLSAAVFVGVAMEMDRHVPREQTWARWLAWGGAAGWLVLAGWVVQISAYGSWQWMQVGVLAVGCIAAGRLREKRHAVIALLAVLIVGLKILMWAATLDAPDATRFLWTLFGLTVAMAGSGYAAVWGSRNPIRWATGAGAVVTTATVLAWWFVAEMRELPWWAISGTAAAVLAGGAWHLGQHREGPQRTQMHQAMGAFAAAAVGLIALALYQLVTAELPDGRQWVATVWALQMAGTVWLANRLKLPSLRVAAAVLAVAVLLRLLVNPAVVTQYAIGRNGHL